MAIGTLAFAGEKLLFYSLALIIFWMRKRGPLRPGSGSLIASNVLLLFLLLAVNIRFAKNP